MIIEHWDSFYEQAVALYRQNPLKTRFVTKYRHSDGKLMLKVTDDATVCLKEGQRGRGARGRQRSGGTRSAAWPPATVCHLHYLACTKRGRAGSNVW